MGNTGAIFFFFLNRTDMEHPPQLGVMIRLLQKERVCPRFIHKYKYKRCVSSFCLQKKKKNRNQNFSTLTFVKSVASSFCT